METLIKLIQSLHEEWGALSWAALGVLLPMLIVAGVMTLRWVLRGGLGSGRVHFFAERRTVEERLKKD